MQQRSYLPAEHRPSLSADTASYSNVTNFHNTANFRQFLVREKLVKDKQAIVLKIGDPGMNEPYLDLDLTSSPGADSLIDISLNLRYLTKQIMRDPAGEKSLFDFEWLALYREELDVAVMPFSENAHFVDGEIFRSSVLRPLKTLLKPGGLLIVTTASEGLQSDISHEIARGFSIQGYARTELHGLHSHQIFAVKREVI